ncbi:acyl-CoA dehydrogenase family protein [Amycolatopsis sp. NPDC059090]|uniref:acyl-CoA dehydrogenase family protein n=1 Tax=Amycolatopsis sp. NPDC059090 TaxID=3346723 RepID=UPI003672409E
MDFALSSDQLLLADHSFNLGAAMNSASGDQVPAGRFSGEQWRRCGDFGLLGLSIPDKYGGLGLDSMSTALAIESFARGHQDMGLTFSACAHLLACAMPIAEHGSEELKQRLLPRLVSGEWTAANAITEPEAGSDVYALQASAKREGGEYVLNGLKSYVSNAPIADQFVVYASTEPAEGYLGISAFVVARETPGLTVGPPFKKPGLITSPIAPLYLDECRIPAANRLGEEGDGRTIFGNSMEWERTCLFAAYVGAMDRQLEQTADHVATRRQFRKPLAQQQAVAHRLADMKLRLESARLLLYRACWLRDRGEARPRDISLAKLAVSEAAIQNGLAAVHLHGGAGFMADAGVEAALNDAVPAAIFSGTSEIHRDIVAAGLRR